MQNIITSKMHILHIANGYGGSSVHRNLVVALDRLGIRQTVYVPLNSRNRGRVGNHPINFITEGSSILYSTVRKWYHKFVYDAQISTITKNLLTRIPIEEITMIHAHTSCLDGGVAYLLHKTTNIPYIVAVRNTDINVYFKKLPWKRKFFLRLLRQAGNIIFISPAYRRIFFDTILNHDATKDIDAKSIVLPNGIDQLFLNNKFTAKRSLHDPVRVIFSGTFNSGKNIHRAIEAIDKVNAKGYNVEFMAIGRGLPTGKNDPEYIDRLEQMLQTRDWARFADYLPQDRLREVFAESDIFAMPSSPETFGLVYVEALTQGLPIIYSKNEGFDGFYDEGMVGYGVDPYDTCDIADKLERIIADYSSFQNRISNLTFARFDWDNIAKEYYTIYTDLINHD